MKIKSVILLCVLISVSALAQEKARVFVTDSQSWEVRGGGGGSSAGFGAATTGGARPQTAEIIKTFGQRCPGVLVNNLQAKADYIVLLDHEGGKGWIRKDNKVAVFARRSGDSIVSKSTMSLGGSVQEACSAILKHWSENAANIIAAAAREDAPKLPPSGVAPELARTIAPKLAITSTPDGADIEVDGSFVGNTPSAMELTAGDHEIVIKKKGYKAWSRKVKLTAGEINLKAELDTLTPANPE